jgi:hypothetical protein
MRISLNTEYAIVGALIVYTVFLPSLPIIRQLLSSSVGVAAGIALVYWVAKTVSVPLALVVLVAVIRSSSAIIREHMDCTTCMEDYTFDEKTKMCKKEGATDLPPTCSGPTKISASPTGMTGPK